MAIEGLGHRVDRSGARKHTDLHGSDFKIGKDGIDLRRNERGRYLVDAENAPGVLRGDRGDDSSTIHTER